MTISSPPLACLWLDPRFCRPGTPSSVQPCATEVSRYTKKPFSEHSWTRSGPEATLDQTGGLRGWTVTNPPGCKKTSSATEAVTRSHAPACQGELRPAVHSKSVPRRARFGLIPDEFFNAYPRTPRWSDGSFTATLWWPYPSAVVHAHTETGPRRRLRGRADPRRWRGVPTPAGLVLLPDHRVAQ